MKDQPAIWTHANPPRDGTTIMAVGEIFVTDPLWDPADGLMTSFRGAIRWCLDPGGYEGWHYARDGMAVASDPNDDVVVVLWTPVPRV
jgi:hypothetical protein